MKFKKGPNTASKYKTLKITYSKNKLNFFWSPLFFAFWGVLVFLVWWRTQNILPTPLSIDNEIESPNEFIAERAERRLKDLVRIGPRVVGSANNEQAAVNFLLDSISSISSLSSPNHRIEWDRQVGSGSFQLSSLKVYKNLQNVVVKLQSLNSTTDSALLINSHFDSVPGSPGAGDDGTMVAVMLEVLRVLAKSNETLKHPIIFLFNGAEEIQLEGSHLFITQHPWAKNIKAFVNLDSAGNGGREVLFQSGPGHPWLIRNYARSARHPFACTLAEEFFQHGFIPSDTDFRIFRDYGRIPGLDFAHIQNGYVYHTEHDKMASIPRGTLQNTGDNILAIAKALANSEELEKPLDHSEGHSVFFDFLGFFLIIYTDFEGIIVNGSVSLIAIMVIVLSFFLMKKNSGLFCRRIFIRFVVIFLIQIASIMIAFGLTIGMAFLLDGIGYSMSWFTENWLIFGVYFCVVFFGLSILPIIYIKTTEENEFFPLNYKIQMFMHSHCLVLVILLIYLTAMGFRSSFLIMISVLFYTIALILNLVTTLQGKAISWIIFPIISQIMPVIFYTYMTFTLLMVYIPMTGRMDGNPEIMISVISFAFALLIGGFLVPLLFVFRKSEILVSLLAVLAITFVVLAVTPIGFPYKESQTYQRFKVQHSTRIFRDISNQVKFNESGFLVEAQDRRGSHTIKDTVLNMSLPETSERHCDRINCGFPIDVFSRRKTDTYYNAEWIPANPPLIVRKPHLRQLRGRLVETVSDNINRFKYEYSLLGPDHMVMVIKTTEICKLVNWSFNVSISELPYHIIHYSYGTSTTDTTLLFWIEVNKENIISDCFEIAVTGHLDHYPIYRTEEYRKFLSTFPKWTYALGTMSYYESFRV